MTPEDRKQFGNWGGAILIGGLALIPVGFVEPGICVSVIGAFLGLWGYRPTIWPDRAPPEDEAETRRRQQLEGFVYGRPPVRERAVHGAGRALVIYSTDDATVAHAMYEYIDETFGVSLDLQFQAEGKAIPPGTTLKTALQNLLAEFGTIFLLCSPFVVEKVAQELGPPRMDWPGADAPKGPVLVCHSCFLPESVLNGLDCINCLDLDSPSDLGTMLDMLNKLSNQGKYYGEVAEFHARIPEADPKSLLLRQQARLRANVEGHVSRLKAQGLRGKAIQREVQCHVKEFSDLAWKTTKPPPLAVVPRPTEKSFQCRFCDLDHCPTGTWACHHCGLPLQDWLAETEVS